LAFNASGHSNTAVGTQALFHNSNGSQNTAIGFGAGDNIIGSGNVDIGWNVGGSGTGSDVNKTRIKNIGSTAIVGGTTVVVASTGGAGDQVLGFASSSRRYKRDIKPMGENSETLFALKPVTFRPDDGVSPSDLKLYGLIAEDVGKVNPDLVAHNDHGEVATIRYEAINAMLLNEFLKEHQKVQKLEAALAAVNERLKEQDAKIDKVNAKVELTKPARQTVLNN
jgi:trimeric autotransporter adhesin